MFLALLVSCSIYFNNGSEKEKQAPIIVDSNPLSKMASYPGIIKFNNRSYLYNVMLVTDTLNSIIWFLRAAWTDSGIIIQVEMASCNDINTFFYDRIIYDKIKKTLKNHIVTTRVIDSNKMKFLEKEFVESLPLAIKKTTDTDILSHNEFLYFCISPKGFGPGQILGYYQNNLYDEFEKLNPGYAKLAGDFRSAIPWVFAEWLIEDGYKIDKKWLAEMRKEYPKRKLDQ